jgi:hypothetical protein
MTITKTPDTVLAEKQEELAALGTGDDLRSNNEREAYHRARQPLDRDVSVLMNAPKDIAALDVRIVPLQTALDKARIAKGVVSDPASLRALRQGVPVIHGHRALPPPLLELLTEVCPHCGNREVIWAGPIPEVEAQLANLTAKRDGYQRQLDDAMREPVLST